MLHKILSILYFSTFGREKSIDFPPSDGFSSETRISGKILLQKRTLSCIIKENTAHMRTMTAAKGALR